MPDHGAMCTMSFVQGQDELRIVMITCDYDASETIFTRSDGKQARVRTAGASVEASALARIHTTPSFDALLAVTKTGDEVLFELAKPGRDQRRGRLAVYLDQNQWRKIANVLYDIGVTGSEDRKAVRQLAEWVHEGRIILPASAAHYHETTKWSDSKRRYYVGLAILQFSRGWQMRDPLQVRRDELRHSIIRQLGLSVDFLPGDVFSLDPEALYSPLRGSRGYSTDGRFPPDIENALKALTVATANIDTMLDIECIEDGPDTGWVAASQRFSDWLDLEKRDRQQKRKSADAFLLSDLSMEIAEEAAAAGADPAQMYSWVISHFASNLGQMPATGLYRELLHDRHLNKRTTWKRNDLTDMIYLSCAAGYADFIVCERHICNHLTQGVKRLGRRAKVFRRLPDLIDPLGAALA